MILEWFHKGKNFNDNPMFNLKLYINITTNFLQIVICVPESANT